MRRALALLALLALIPSLSRDAAYSKSNSVLVPFVRTIHAGGGGGGGLATIFTTTLPNPNTGNGGYSIRQELAAPAVTGSTQGHIQVSITSNGGSLQLDHASYCISTGGSSNCTAAPIELTFPGSCGTSCTSGGSGFTCTAWPCTALSNWIAFAPPGTDVVVTMDITPATAGDLGSGGTVTGATTWYKGATASWNVQAPAGFTSIVTNVYGVALIQTKP